MNENINSTPVYQDPFWLNQSTNLLLHFKIDVDCVVGCVVGVRSLGCVMHDVVPGGRKMGPRSTSGAVKVIGGCINNQLCIIDNDWETQ